MKPFGALCFIKNNMLRCIVLAIMMGCVTVCYMGALYMDNISEPFWIRYNKKIDNAYVYKNTSNNGAIEEQKELGTHIEDYLTEHVNKYMYIDMIGFDFTSIMGFNNNMGFPVFESVEDYKEFRNHTSMFPKDLEVKDGELVVSRMYANNVGIKDGDTIIYNKNAGKCDRVDEHTVRTSFVRLYKGELKARIIDVDGMLCTGVSKDYDGNDGCLFFYGTGDDKDKIENDIKKISDEINGKFKNLRAENNKLSRDDLNTQIGFMYSVLGMIIVVVGAVIAITVNATYAATYEKRKYEFSIYKALGFKRREIISKITKETIILNITGILFGTVVCTISVAILNNLLYERGLHFYSISSNGIIATVICNALVVIPVILLSFKRTAKYDVTAY